MWITILTYGVCTLMYALFERGIRRLFFNKEFVQSIKYDDVRSVISSPKILAVTPIYHLWMLTCTIVTVVLRLFEKNIGLETYNAIELGYELTCMFVYFGKPELSIPVNDWLMIRHITRIFIIIFAVEGSILPQRIVEAWLLYSILSFSKSIGRRGWGWMVKSIVITITSVLYVFYVWQMPYTTMWDGVTKWLCGINGLASIILLKQI